MTLPCDFSTRDQSIVGHGRKPAWLKETCYRVWKQPERPTPELTATRAPFAP